MADRPTAMGTFPIFEDDDLTWPRRCGEMRGALEGILAAMDEPNEFFRPLFLANARRRAEALLREQAR